MLKAILKLLMFAGGIVGIVGAFSLIGFWGGAVLLLSFIFALFGR